MSKRSEFSDSFREKSSNFDYERIPNGLGWFSLGLGLAEIAAPGTIAGIAGVQDTTTKRTILRSPLYGMREVAAGAGILMQDRPAGWLWSRVAGDLVDISTLALALGSPENDRRKVTGALVAVLGITALDYLCAQNLTQQQQRQQREGISSAGRRNSPNQTIKTIWVNKSPEEAYSFWRKFENLPRFMHHLESVETMPDGRSKWRAVGPMGKTYEWEARTEQDQPNRLIAWKSVENSDIQNSGTVFFEPGPGGRGTIIRVDLSYDPPGGAVGSGLAKLLGKDGSQMLRDDLRAFKQVIETGEVLQSDASIHKGMHPGQPPKEPYRIKSKPEPVLA